MKERIIPNSYLNTMATSLSSLDFCKAFHLTCVPLTEGPAAPGFGHPARGAISSCHSQRNTMNM